MNKKTILPAIVLTSICVVVAALLAVVNFFAEPVIIERNEEVISKSLSAVMEGGKFNAEPDELKENAPETISKVYTEKNGKGTVVVLVTNEGYTGKNIGFTVGIDSDGKITGMQITQNEESIVPDELKPGGSYGDHYVGAGAEDIPELTTGATVLFTESAIKGAINDAFAYLGFGEDSNKIPRDEAEVESLAKALYGSGAENLEVSIPEETEFVKRIYKEEGKSSFVAYAFSISQYGTPEFEFLIHVDESGKIKAIDKILWKVSDPKPEWGYNPPSDEAVDTFFDSFVDKNSSNVSSVEVQTGATSTSTKVRDAATEALGFFVPKIPREISEIASRAKALYSNSAADLKCTELEGYDYASLMFKEDGKSFFIVYAFSISQYGTPEFEFLIHVDESGKVKAIDKILWKVSDPKPEWGYNPPSDEEVDAFFDSFVDKGSSNISSVDVGTGATSTSTKVRDAATEALKLYKPKIPREISEIAARAKALYPDPDAELNCTELEGYDYAGLVFKEFGKKSYIIYSYNYSQYGTPEFEFLIYVDETKTIKAIDKLLWKVSDPKPEWGYNPPSDEKVDAFFNSFVDKNAGNVSSVEVQTGATSTATKVRDAATEALKYTPAEEITYTARVIGIAVLAVSLVGFVAFVIISKKRRTAKK